MSIVGVQESPIEDMEKEKYKLRIGRKEGEHWFSVMHIKVAARPFIEEQGK